MSRRARRHHHRVGNADDPAAGGRFGIDQARPAAASFLARYNGRTLEAHRHDLRGLFQWAGDNGIAGLEATRPHIELFRAWVRRRDGQRLDRRTAHSLGGGRYSSRDCSRRRSASMRWIRMPSRPVRVKK